MKQSDKHSSLRSSTSHRDLRLTFYREEGCWYADVPGHTQSQNQMVAGADRLIESFDSGRGRLKVVMSSDVDDPRPYLVRLHRIEHDPFGATYWASSGDAPDAPRISFATIPVAWLCNVTHDVFGEHPRDIYIHAIQ